MKPVNILNIQTAKNAKLIATIINENICGNFTDAGKKVISSGPSCSKLTTSIVNDSLKF